MKSSLIQTPHTCHIAGSTSYASTGMRDLILKQEGSSIHILCIQLN